MSITRSTACFLSLLFLAALRFSTSAHASFLDPGTIHIGVLAKSGKEQCFQQWNPTGVYLQNKIQGKKIQIVCLGFDEVDKAVADKHVDFTITNPSVYVNLEYKYGASRISTLKHKQAFHANVQFGGVIFYRADRKDIKTINDLKGKKFMAVAENSFGGWQVSWRYLKERNIDPSKDFQELHFGATHEAVVMAIINGQVDVGCVRTDVLENMATLTRINLNDLAVLDPQTNDSQFSSLRTTRLYPEWPLAKAEHTSEEMAKKVGLAMLGMPDNSIASFYSHSRGWTIPLDYNEVHECLRRLKVAPYADYGIITISQMYHQYKYWIYVGIVFLVCTFSGLALVARLNRKLSCVLLDLQSEHRQRAQVVADLNEFKRTLDQTLDCVFMFSSDTLHFIYANQGALNHIGYSLEELLKMTPIDIKPEYTASQFKALVVPLQEQQDKSLTFITKHKRKDGVLVPVEIFMQHITPPDKKGRFVAIVRDITIRLQKETERKSLQSKLLQEQKLASVGQLAAGIAHEINTPAQYIGSNIDFLDEAFRDIARLVDHVIRLVAAAKKEDISPQLLTAVEDTLEEIDWSYLKEEIPESIRQSGHGVKQVSSIVLAMKNFAHPGGTEKELTDLNELIQNTLTISRNEWKYAVVPQLQLDPLLPPILCLRNEIGQVFLNIFVNAVQSITEKLSSGPNGSKGQITISTRLQKDHAIITVTDSGCGIGKDNLEKIFDPFFTTKEVGKGTGQGLAIAYDIVTNKHGGILEVTSEEGVGTTFTITLLLNPSLHND